MVQTTGALNVDSPTTAQFNALIARVATLEQTGGGDNTALLAEIAALKATVTSLQAEVDALQAGGGGGGSLPTGTVSNLTVTGKLTVRGEIDLWATNSPSSRAFTIINPKGSSYDSGYPMIRWEREQSDGSKKFLFGLVTHEKGTDGTTHKHFSMYRARYGSTTRDSVFDYDFDVAENVGSSPRPYLDIENTEVRLSKGSTLKDKNGNEILG